VAFVEQRVEDHEQVQVEASEIHGINDQLYKQSVGSMNQGAQE